MILPTSSPSLLVCFSEVGFFYSILPSYGSWTSLFHDHNHSNCVSILDSYPYLPINSQKVKNSLHYVYQGPDPNTIKEVVDLLCYPLVDTMVIVKSYSSARSHDLVLQFDFKKCCLPGLVILDAHHDISLAFFPFYFKVFSPKDLQWVYSLLHSGPLNMYVHECLIFIQGSPIFPF